MTGYGPPDDPSEAPTGQYNYGDDGDYGQQPADRPWHRRPAVLIGLGVLVAILLALVIWGIVELSHGGAATSPATSSTTSTSVSTTPSTSTAGSSSETTSEPASTTSPTTGTPTTSASTSATPPTSTSTDEHHHHHHHNGGVP